MASIDYLSKHHQAGCWRVIWTSFVAVVCLHIAVGTSNIEVERYVLHSLGLLVATDCGSLIVLTQRLHHEMLTASSQANTACVSFSFGVLSILTVYRVLLH